MCGRPIRNIREIYDLARSRRTAELHASSMVEGPDGNRLQNQCLLALRDLLAASYPTYVCDRATVFGLLHPDAALLLVQAVTSI